ncbi:hypothetical protein PVAP13_4NG057050 [Panicum virgatum]|uniref:Uncharacterized protein n=1 Tax=Panicum virgatum TaxID=38727 RepID=A0A8T0T4W9_PANVG|nr:hypothetical protein PVAP13_4NG057050 [Panicum virgatum]
MRGTARRRRRRVALAARVNNATRPPARAPALPLPPAPPPPPSRARRPAQALLHLLTSSIIKQSSGRPISLLQRAGPGLRARHYCEGEERIEDEDGHKPDRTPRGRTRGGRGTRVPARIGRSPPTSRSWEQASLRRVRSVSPIPPPLLSHGGRCVSRRRDPPGFLPSNYVLLAVAVWLDGSPPLAYQLHRSCVRTLLRPPGAGAGSWLLRYEERD